ncbi:MAG: ABC transporter permease [Chlamydiales bacterium]|nr:ABC transporter permease [Chlamydiia bacterium]MCP5507353.1 ABC transporter permease [Chlamydiales bacterium]
MKMHRLLAIARKECIQIKRDWRSLFLTIGTPIFLLVLFAYALTLDVDNVPMTIWDQSKTPESRDLISRFVGSRYFTIKGGYANNYKEIEHALDTGKASIALVIPENFASRLDSGLPAKIQLLVDGSDANTATISLGYADAVAHGFSKELFIEEMRHQGKEPPKPAIDLRTRVWFNPDKESKNNIIPGLIGVIMMVIASLMTSLTVAREWERGTMEQLIATPMKSTEMIFGKMLPYFAMGAIDVLLIVLIGKFVFEVPFRGSYLLLVGMATLFLIGALSLGMLISIVTKSQLLASQLATVLTFLPSFLLSGFLSAINNMPEPIQAITYFVPARYFITFLRAIYLKGVGLSILYTEGIFLLLFALTMALAANIVFKKKLT